MSHRVKKLWTRPDEGGDPVEQKSLTVKNGKGIVGDHTFGRMRHVTIVFQDDWDDAARQLGREVDPVGRRANVLLSGGNGERYLGTTLKLGRTTLRIKGITEPCPIMDKAAEGMRDALMPHARAGIWGRVEIEGEIRLDDEVTIDGQEP